MRVWDLWHSVPSCSESVSSSMGKADVTWYPCSIGLGHGHTEGVGCVTVSCRQTSYEEGRAAIYSASGDKVIKRWDLHGLLKAIKSDGAKSMKSKGGQNVVSRLDNKGDDNTQEVAGLQGLLLKVNQEVPSTTDSVGASLSCTHSVRGHEKDINCVTLSPNDALLASGSQTKPLSYGTRRI